MLIEVLLVAHIAVLGYWLGAEMTINSTYRYVSWSSTMPFIERDRLMDHVLEIDQHVRYALILQVALGVSLGALLGYFPGGLLLVGFAAAVCAAWLALAEIAHRRRKLKEGEKLAAIDRAVRYVVIGLLLLVAGASLIREPYFADWLAVKLILFAGVIGCGVAVRFALIRFYRVWRVIREDGFVAEHELRIRRIYVVATMILGVLWVLIIGIVFLSITKTL